MRALVLCVVFVSLHSTLGLDRQCGGLLESDGGEFELPSGEMLERGQVCVWIVKLISRQTVQFNLTELGEGLTVSLYEEHSPSQSIEPTRLSSSDVGISIANDGQTLVVVLTQSGFGRGFAFSWDSLESTGPEYLTVANYVNRKSGRVLWNRFNNRQRLTLSLNTDQSQALDVETIADFGDCSRANECKCSYVAIYEITSDGLLQEVNVACDRPSETKVRNLLPNILAFVYLNSSHSVNPKDFAEIKWTTSNSDVSSTTTATTLATSTTSASTEPSTTPAPIVIRNECGGTVQVGLGETVIEYSLPGSYIYGDFCVWTLLPTVAYSGFSIDYLSYGGEDGLNGVTIYNWGEDGDITTKRIYPNNINSTISLSKPYAVIAFSSASNSRGLGFQVTIRGTGHLESNFKYRGFWFNQTEGKFSYPEEFGLKNYEPNEIVAVVVQSNMTIITKVAIDFTDIEDDPLSVYLLDIYYWGGGPIVIGRTNGSNPDGVPSLTTNDFYPTMHLFNSNDNSKTGKGFSLSWKKP